MRESVNVCLSSVTSLLFSFRFSFQHVKPSGHPEDVYQAVMAKGSAKAVKREREAAAVAPKAKKTKQSEETTPTKEGTNFFSHVLGMPRAEFFDKYFEKKHFVHSHGSPQFFTAGSKDGVVPPVDWSTKRMVETVKAHEMHYGTDLNVVRFDAKLKKRVPYKTEGIVNAAEMEKCMKEGWSVRFLRPHEFLPCNSAFISMMEGEFNCYCGLNTYWTPANSQGFAPHYDDVDVFLLQMEGEKNWLLYDPPEEVDYLSRHSSEDYLPEDFPKPKYSITLKAGDVLYLPRGMVHQGHTSPSTHSLHITFSANQMNSWADWMSRAARYSVETLAANSIEWRRALPRDLTYVLGEICHPEFRAAAGLPPLTASEASHRAELQSKLREFVAELTLLMTDEANMDICTDVYAKDTVNKMQPLSAKHSHLLAKDAPLAKDSSICLATKNCCRLMLNEPGEAVLYHNGDNTPVCLQSELGELRFEALFGPAIATLFCRFPKPTKISSLPFPDLDDPDDVADNQLLLATTLRDEGLLGQPNAQ